MRSITKKNLEKTYKLADTLFPKISNSCKKCKNCCFTYGFLLKEEAETFIKMGLPLIQINGKIYCFDSFKKTNKGKRIIEKIPRCIFYKDGKCIIYKQRPLDCRLYPLKIRFQKQKNQGIIGISLGCKYISDLNHKKRQKLCYNIIKFFKKAPNTIRNKYLEMIYIISQISKKKQFKMKEVSKISRIKKEQWKLF